MCRRKQLYGCGMILFGVGMMVGLWIHSWFWCGCGGIILCGIGFGILKSR